MPRSSRSRADTVGFSSTYPMFKTAGRNTDIVVSDEGLAMATSLLDKEPSTSGKLRSNLLSGQRSSGSVQPNIAPNRLSSDKSGTAELSSRFPAFKTAGSNTDIAVSDEGLAMATSIFDEDNMICDKGRFDSNRGSGSQANLQQTPDASCGNAERVEEKPGSSLIFPTMFRTAGNSKPITVSDESMGKVNEIFNDSSTYAGKKTGVSVTQGHPNEATNLMKTNHSGASKGSLAHRQDNTKLGNDWAGTESSRQGFLTSGFTTGGSKAPITVTGESMTDADRILSSDGDGGVDVSSNTVRREFVGSKKVMTGFATGGSNRTIVVSTEDIDRVGRFLNEDERTSNNDMSLERNAVKGTIASGFTKGGSSVAIAVTEQNVADSRHLFESEDCGDGVFKNNEATNIIAATHCDAEPTRHRERQSVGISLDASDPTNASRTSHNRCLGRDSGVPPKPTLTGFAVAGTGRIIDVPEDSLASASNIFEDEQTLGVGVVGSARRRDGKMKGYVTLFCVALPGKTAFRLSPRRTGADNARRLFSQVHITKLDR